MLFLSRCIAEVVLMVVLFRGEWVDGDLILTIFIYSPMGYVLILMVIFDLDEMVLNKYGTFSILDKGVISFGDSICYGNAKTKGTTPKDDSQCFSLTLEIDDSCFSFGFFDNGDFIPHIGNKCSRLVTHHQFHVAVESRLSQVVVAVDANTEDSCQDFVDFVNGNLIGFLSFLGFPQTISGEHMSPCFIAGNFEGDIGFGHFHEFHGFATTGTNRKNS